MWTEAMSTKRLNQDERASFLIGEAFRKAMVNKAHAPAQQRLFWDAYVRALDGELTTDELDDVMIATGFVATCWLPGSENDHSDGVAEAASLEADEQDHELPF
jgi:hypothetical protein